MFTVRYLNRKNKRNEKISEHKIVDIKFRIISVEKKIMLIRHNNKIKIKCANQKYNNNDK